MSKLTVEGLVKLLKEVEQDVGLENLELFTDGSGSIKGNDGNIILIWDSLEGMFNDLSQLVFREDIQSNLVAKFN